MSEPLTLNETLKQLGYSTQEGQYQYTKDILKDGETVCKSLSSQETWDWLRSQGLIDTNGCIVEVKR